MTYDPNEVYEVRGVRGVFVALHVRETANGTVTFDDTSRIRLLPHGGELVPMSLERWNSRARQVFNRDAPRFESRDEMLRALYSATRA